MENQRKDLNAEKVNLVKELMALVNEYKKIGEPEELAEMKKRYTPKAPLKGGNYTGYNCFICPWCSRIVGNSMERVDFCPDCGQKLDWTEEDIRQKEEEQKSEIIMDGKGYVVKETGDKAKATAIKAALKSNDGYCPCRIVKSEDTRCMCREFLDKLNDPEFFGPCHCSLYEKRRRRNQK